MIKILVIKKIVLSLRQAIHSLACAFARSHSHSHVRTVTPTLARSPPRSLTHPLAHSCAYFTIRISGLHVNKAHIKLLRISAAMYASVAGLPNSLWINSAILARELSSPMDTSEKRMKEL